MAAGDARAHQELTHSRCVQLECNSIKDAVSFFSRGGDGSDAQIALVLIPKARSWASFAGWWLTIPTGCYCLMQRFGRDCGTAPPGGSIKPPFYRIAYVVTQQSCTYNAPVKECPTSDNVRVGIDLVIVFQIRDPQAFVYKLGATKFDQLLSGAVDEGIRILVRSLNHQSVYTLRAEGSDSVKTHLNKKFEGTGVVFGTCTITHVELPQELRMSLEKSTELKKGMEKTKRDQEYEIGEIQRKSAIELEEMGRKNENIIVMEMGRKKRAGLEHQDQMVKASAKRQDGIINADAKIQVDKAEATALLQRTLIQVQQYQVEMESQAQADAEAKRVAANVAYQSTTLNAEAEMKKLQSDAMAIKLDADAENEASRHLVQKRKFELDIREKEILNKLAQKGNFNLIGQPGDRMVEAVMTGSWSSAAPPPGAAGQGGGGRSGWFGAR